MRWWRLVFQQFLNASPWDQLSSYQLPVTGQNAIDQLAFSGQTREDANGNPVTSLKYSRNNGSDWIDIDLSNIKVYDAAVDGMPLLSENPITDDEYSTTSWVQGPCGNRGDYPPGSEYRRQHVSYEMDAVFTLSRLISEDYLVDVFIDKAHTKSDEVDAIVSKHIDYPYDIDAMIATVRSKPYLIDRLLETIRTKEQSVDVIVSKNVDVLDRIDVLLAAIQKKYCQIDVCISTNKPKPYLVDVILSKPNRRTAIENGLPQVLDLDLSSTPIAPMDSRKKTGAK
jgi:hypothetical protein